MATYVIGDVQGCWEPLERLLDKMNYDPSEDRLWFTGDLVNRGPDSLKVLRFVKDLGKKATTVLGNHDLHLVAAALSGNVRKKDTFQDIIDAPDGDELVRWLRRQPLVHAEDDVLLVHAGLAPQWTADKALALSAEASALMASKQADEFFLKHMYGDLPDLWSDDLKKWDRLRFIVNCCTRLRFGDADGRLDFGHKGAPGSAGGKLMPWFAIPGRETEGRLILFGHWSLLGRVWWPQHKVYGLDTGAVWGKELTGYCIEEHKLFSVKSGTSAAGSED